MAQASAPSLMLKFPKLSYKHSKSKECNLNSTVEFKVVSTTEKTESKSTLKTKKKELKNNLTAIYALFLLEDTLLPEVLTSKKLVFHPTIEDKLTLMITGKQMFPEFTLLEMLSRDKCLLTKPKKKESQPLNTSLEKVAT
jgi:hypothetical protein